ncbi:unnamed protein product [Angiostrongylus costaricensis]|uniref:Velvet domain-containing protein n=1 Tax=Angiostrongylus costaricensis TaxID=334426 RepID=A0A0R3PE72_ANGCS|nr:unnamed protein product [Angiostrongylus costaricensis]
MVRTYGSNPPIQESNFSGNLKDPFVSPGNSHPRSFQQVQSEDLEIVPLQDGNHQSDHQCLCSNALPQHHMPFHSPYVDPIGSIIGLRVLCSDGKLCYVPIEPELNYLINQQFGVRWDFFHSFYSLK